MEGSVPKKIEAYFLEAGVHSDLGKCDIFVSRPDGVLIYSQLDETQKIQIGALVGGLWQAARELANYIPGNKNAEEYKLSFGSGSNGIHVLPLTINAKEYFFGGVYHDEINPALVKYRLKEMQNGLEILLSEFEKKRITQTEDKKEEFLFSDISDKEMDDLFSFTEL